LIEFPDFCNIIDNLKKEEDRLPTDVDLPQHWMDDLKDVFSVFDTENRGFIDKQVTKTLSKRHQVITWVHSYQRIHSSFIK
jgi:Ca2+-binding EF-hand superfamily protein